MNAETGKRIHPILQLPERFQNLSIQFGREPELSEIQSVSQLKGPTSPAKQPRMSAVDPAASKPDCDLTTEQTAASIQGQTPCEPPFRLYDLVKLDPGLFWELYHARAYDDLLLRLTYERFLPEQQKGKTNYIETIHLTGTSHEPAKTNALEFWHAVEDGVDDALLELHPDPTNTHDPNAIRVLSASTKKQIGWIPAKDKINELVARNYHLGCFNSAQLIKVETGAPNAGKDGRRHGTKSGTIGIQIAIGWTFPTEILQKYGKSPE